jgi:prephenate dehydrogenase
MKPESPFKNIAIAGVGLIGGSIGLGLKKYARGTTITGVGRNCSRLKAAKRLGAIDKITLNLAEGVKDKDLIILAQPVAVIRKALAEIAQFLKKGQVIIDVGGTKEGILKQARKSLPAGVHFIGTHPLAGSEKTGVKAASPGLFLQSKCICIKHNNKEALGKTARIFRILGCKIIFMTAHKHDELLAAISHLPHLAAQALVGTVGGYKPQALKLASSGFRDVTRIAGSSPDIWRDIFIENKKNVLRLLAAYGNELKKLRGFIDKEEAAELLSYLTRIKNIRNRL